MKIVRDLVDLISTPSKTLFRAIALVLLVVLIVSQLPWLNSIVGRLLKFSDLRHRISEVTCRSGLSSVDLEVVNQGFGKAENVIVHIHTPDNYITDYEVNSQELYEIEEADLQEGIIDISLDRLAPGASLQVELFGPKIVTATLSLSATSDQGSSISVDAPGIADYAADFKELFSAAGEAIWKAERLEIIRSEALNNPALSELLSVFKSHVFRQLGLATLIIVIAIVLFLPRGYLLMIPLFVGLVYWLVFGIPVSEGGQALCCTGFIFLFIFALVAPVFSEQQRSSAGRVSQITPDRTESARVVAAHYEQRISQLEQALTEGESERKALLDILKRSNQLRFDPLSAARRTESARVIATLYEQKIARLEEALAGKEVDWERLLRITENLSRQKEQSAGEGVDRASDQGED